ncbi:MAG: hypothetical protein R3F48_03875 [Candidatus Zixiibacteriota bacterium]
MRKFIILFCFGILLCASTASLNAECGLCGDLDGDGTVDMTDVTAFIAWYYQWPPITPECPGGGDINCDNSVQIWELDYIIAYLYEGGPAPCDPEVWPACAE